MSAFQHLFWAPILGAATAWGVLIVLLKGWWRLLAVVYALLIYYPQGLVTDLVTMMLLESWL